MSGIYDTLNKQWKSTCRVVLTQEIGELLEYEEWLREDIEPIKRVKSSISGKEILAVGEYPKDAKFVSFDEVEQAKKFEPLSINDIKDIDSIAQAMKERAVYCGNVVLGNSSKIEGSAGIEDSHFVLDSHTLHKSGHIAHCTLGREDKHTFGCCLVGESSFCIKCGENWRSTRCLCTTYVYESADVYFSHYLYGCQECMFCFNLKGKRNCIGNAQLEKGKYAEIKRELLAQMADELKKGKRLESIEEMVANFPVRKVSTAQKNRAQQDISPLKEAFAKLTELMLGKRLELEPLGKYLLRHTRKTYPVENAAGNSQLYACPLAFEERMVRTGRAANWQDIDALTGEMRNEKEIAGISFANAGKFIEKIAYFCPDKEYQCNNIEQCANAWAASNCLLSSKNYFSKYVAYSFWTRNCEHMFGCEAMRNSSFCIKCYNSYKLSRCFEADTSQNCTGGYFLHNCENVHDSMFCFNVKNLRYAIGNAEVGREKFMEAKAALQRYIVERLEKGKELELDIYNVGAAKRKN